MDFKDFWYAVAESKELKRDAAVSAKLLGCWIALFRDETGKAVALEDRCLHRCAQLSKGRARAGRLQCGYHRWVYDGGGRVVSVPSDGPNGPKMDYGRARSFSVCEADDYIYVRLRDASGAELKPFRIPYYREKGWSRIRLKNLFRNNVTNCVENFVDIPHTAFVHPKIFRAAKNERFTARVHRRNGSVTVSYGNERANLGIFSRFLNPAGREISHTDSFHMPNITSVDYDFGRARRFIITSQSIPMTEQETLVRTDLSYNYGIWNSLARPIIKWQARTIINQDIAILGNQMETIEKHGAHFSNAEADCMHVLIESIRGEIAEGRDPRLLPEETREIEFWV
jgi:phenylpropionate dioxygenase-like ring-hydroxylating dioxygenase large terminal subunit